MHRSHNTNTIFTHGCSQERAEEILLEKEGNIKRTSWANFL